MEPTKQPQVKLKGIEYLLLAIQSEPGKSQRHYLRRLHRYKYGVEDYHKGGTCCGYFISPSYRNVLWYNDDKKPGVKYECSKSVNEVFQSWFTYPPGRGTLAKRSRCSVMKLTLAGHKRANEVRKKLGLDPIDLSDKVSAHANFR